MNLNDFDFNAIKNMYDSLSEDEKSSLNSMAQNMMDTMGRQAQDVQEEAEEEPDMYELLGIPEEKYTDLPGNVLSMMEAGSDIEQFYSEDAQADLSAAALYFCKALLFMLRRYAWPVLHDQLMMEKSQAASTLQDYYGVLMVPGNVSSLEEAGFGNEPAFRKLCEVLFQAYLQLSRAEYDSLSSTELDMLKEELFKDEGLLLVRSVFTGAGER